MGCVPCSVLYKHVKMLSEKRLDIFCLKHDLYVDKGLASFFILNFVYKRNSAGIKYMN